MKTLAQEEVLGIKIDNLTKSEVEKKVKETVESEKKLQIITLNTEMLVHFLNSANAKNANNREKLVIAESSGLLIASDFLRQATNSRVLNVLKIIVSGFKVVFKGETGNLKERIPGVDLSESLAALTASKNWKLMLLGGEKGVAEKAAGNLKKKFPGLKVLGSSGSKEPFSEQNRLVREINDYQPQILLVAFGHGKQERWVEANLDKLKVNVAAGVGGSLDFLSGKVQRAPKWLQNLGLEWVFRLLRQPWRLKRQLALVKFLSLLSQQKRAL